MILNKVFHCNPLEENTVILWREGSKQCVVVDPGMWTDAEKASVQGFLDAEGLVPEAILLTHGHFDHTLGVAALRERHPVPVYLHPADRDLARLGAGMFPGFHGKAFGTPEERDSWLRDATLPVSEAAPVMAAGMTFQFIETPGHSSGSVCYLLEEADLLLSGDTLFAGAIGRSDFPGGDYDALIRSVMDKLMGLDGDVELIPGHGPRTTIGREAMTNPFLIPFNEPDTAWWNQDGIELEGV